MPRLYLMDEQVKIVQQRVEQLGRALFLSRTGRTWLKRDSVGSENPFSPEQRRPLELAAQNQDIEICNQTAMDGALMLDRMEEDDARQSR